MERIRAYLSGRRGFIILFLAILLVGIFLRTYEFHDFLRFNADQSRDVTLVREYVEGDAPLPLLGPKAGGTDFRVGPAFYYFQIAAAKFFGVAPDSVAYPDLLFSVLAIPLLFLFLRRYFDMRTAMILMVLFAVSFYAVKYSRFAWNPNSLPFWSMLFLLALHEVAVAGELVKKYWVALLGISLGIGLQLHTLSLVFFPIMILSVFGFLFFRKRMPWKIFGVVVALALFVNVPQIVSEVRTGGANVSSFFDGADAKEKKGSGIVRNILKDTVCFTQANAYILSSYDSDDGCSLKSVQKGLNMPVFAAGLLFFLGGIWLAICAFRRETDRSRKYFLGIVFLYLGLSFVILLPLANEVSMRFFLAMLFMPFVFLGLWMDFVREKCPRYALLAIALVTLVLVVSNLLSLQRSFAESAAHLTNSDAGMDNVMLREVELASAFIISQSAGATMIAVDGDAQFLFKTLKSMNYFTSHEGITLVEKKKKTDPTLPVFLIENTRQTDDILARQNVSAHLFFGRFTIFKLQ